MKNRSRNVLALLALLTLNLPLSIAHAQGTAFTYQGQLIVNGALANGLYDFRFKLAVDDLGDTDVGAPFLTNAIPVTNGLFITTVNFGTGLFNGSNYWLEVDVRTNNPPNTLAYTELTPLQAVTPVPYAIFATTASNVSGTFPATQLSGPVPSADLTSVPAASLTGPVLNNQLANSSITLTAGNGLSGGGAVALGGSTTLNNAGVTALTGGDGVTVSASSGSVTLGLDSTLGLPALPVTINSGGTLLMNFDTDNNSFVGFSAGPNTGTGDTGVGYYALNDSGGNYNTGVGFEALHDSAGNYNTGIGVEALSSLSGGSGNTSIGSYTLYRNFSGNNNTAVGYDALEGLGAFGVGGTNNIAVGYGAGSAFDVNESSNIDIGNNGVQGESGVIRIGSSQSQTFIAGVIHGNGGVLTNLNASQLTSIGNSNSFYGGNFFIGPSGNSTVSGYNNTADGVYALVSNTSGSENTANGNQALFLNISGSFNTADGVQALLENTSGSDNTANGFAALYSNTNGSDNTANGYLALSDNISGSQNTANGASALAANTTGTQNTANGFQALQSNTTGSQDTADGMNALVGNITGTFNTANGVGAMQNNTNGSQNVASGYQALFSNTRGTNNIAVGCQAGFNITIGNSNIDIGNEGMGADNNIIRIGTSQTATYLVGNVYTPSGTVEMGSDRNTKENFMPVNPQAVLARLASLPVAEWNYKTGLAGDKHLGPMAQDFHAAFGLNGADDKHISVVDEGGVALAAIQGLNQKLEETQQAVKAKDDEIQDLKQRLETLEKIVLKQKSN